MMIRVHFSFFYLGIGDWGLGIGDWGLGPIPNPQSPIPNPQSPSILGINIKIKLFSKIIFRKLIKIIDYSNILK